MACLVRRKCLECGEEKQMDLHTSRGVCYDCRDKKIQLKRESHFKFLDTLTVEQRLRKVEEWIYDYRPQHVPPTLYA